MTHKQLASEIHNLSAQCSERSNVVPGTSSLTAVLHVHVSSCPTRMCCSSFCFKIPLAIIPAATNSHAREAARNSPAGSSLSPRLDMHPAALTKICRTGITRDTAISTILVSLATPTGHTQSSTLRVSMLGQGARMVRGARARSGLSAVRVTASRR